MPASPHPRGWTLAHGALEDGGVGFPAPAGMDPQSARTSRVTTRLPRTRGDGPAACRSARSCASASPHPRGWTRGHTLDSGYPDGFPAPAGMDPRPDDARLQHARLPRTRGDGPIGRGMSGSDQRASPHPRGWTPERHVRRPVPRGFPAPAGMDLLSRMRRAVAHGLPRTRGDGPLTLQHDRALPLASPHPRGWTPGPPRPPTCARGFPAPAGMDRIHRVLTHLATGFPAPAGMDPGPAWARMHHMWLPRTRGDGPVAARILFDAGLASPHPRGWTPAPAPAVVRRVGFPAPAGMDRSRRRARRGRARLPRTRGDGPCVLCASPTAVMASPHPRGWTLDRAVTLHVVAGFPAPAGMDR